MEVHDLRFPTSKDLSGSDAVHKDPDYSCVYLVLHTDSPRVPRGYGLTFTLGRGNEVVAACAKALQVRSKKTADRRRRCCCCCCCQRGGNT
jgi:L-fuconate dehydratase